MHTPHITWLVKGKVLLQRYWGNFEVSEYREAMGDVYQLLNSTESHIVHALLDVSQVKGIPIQIPAIRDASKRVYEHNKMGYIAIFGRTDTMMSFVITVVAQLFKGKTQLFKTEKEALDFILQQLNDEDAEILRDAAKYSKY